MDDAKLDRILQMLEEHGRDSRASIEALKAQVSDQGSAIKSQGEALIRVDERTIGMLKRMDRMDTRSSGIAAVASTLVSAVIVGWKMLTEGGK